MEISHNFWKIHPYTTDMTHSSCNLSRRITNEYFPTIAPYCRNYMFFFCITYGQSNVEKKVVESTLKDYGRVCYVYTYMYINEKEQFTSFELHIVAKYCI